VARYAASLATADLWSALATDVRRTAAIASLSCGQTDTQRQTNTHRQTDREREREREKVPGRDYGGK